MKKSTVTQELVNLFPSWSKIRYNQQSIGFQYLNTIAKPLEKMEKELARAAANAFLTTANISELDQLHRIQLPVDYEFTDDNDDPLVYSPTPPTVSGEQDGTWHTVSITEENDIEAFWYNSVPTRVSLDTVVSGEEDELLSWTTSGLVEEGEYAHHLADTEMGGHMWVEAVGGVQYLTEEEGELSRGKIVIQGETRKGLLEEEVMIFPWDMKQPTQKEWKVIHNISAYDMEDTVDITVRSADFNGGPYMDRWNIRYSQNRRKIDEFWDLGLIGSVPTLDRIEYITDEWQQMILGFSNKDTKESWELLDDGLATVEGVDLALQPWSDYGWVVTEAGMLYCYDLNETTVSGVELLKSSTPGAHVQFEIEDYSVIRGEEIVAIPWHARPLKEIQKYKIWYQQPDGQKFGLLNNVAVPYTSDFEVKVTEGTPLTRTVENVVTVDANQLGEYLLVIEVTFVDGEEQQARALVSVNYKTPEATFDLSSIITDDIEGIDFDSDHRMWIKTTLGDYYRLNLHKDLMLIDYDNKQIYFIEEYEEVYVSDG